MTTPTYCGKLPDHGDGIIIYVHGLHGFVIHTHRTFRVSPAGWVWAVLDELGQYAYGYTTTQRDALAAASAYIAPATTTAADAA
jgi:hypothetical protein